MHPQGNIKKKKGKEKQLGSGGPLLNDTEVTVYISVENDTRSNTKRHRRKEVSVSRGPPLGDDQRARAVRLLVHHEPGVLLAVLDALLGGRQGEQQHGGLQGGRGADH